jgi:hypothetical protein
MYTWIILSTHSKVFICKHKHPMSVQYEVFKWNPQAFRVCSILTQRPSCALTSVQGVFISDMNENFFMFTPWWGVFGNDSQEVMVTQWVFTLTQWCKSTLNGCSGEGLHTHSLVSLFCNEKCAASLFSHRIQKEMSHWCQGQGSIYSWHIKLLCLDLKSIPHGLKVEHWDMTSCWRDCQRILLCRPELSFLFRCHINVIWL